MISTQLFSKQGKYVNKRTLVSPTPSRSDVGFDFGLAASAAIVTGVAVNQAGQVGSHSAGRLACLSIR